MTDPLYEILRLCAAAAPAPFYPRTAALPSPLTRGELDDGLERLRRGGLLTLTEWEANYGQGYVLTPSGVRALADPAQVVRLDAPPPRPAEDDLGEPRPRGQDVWERGEAVRNALLTETRPIVTYALLALNISIFLQPFLGVQLGPWQLHDLFTLRTGDLAVGGWRWLRLLSCCFVHGGAIHLFMNMYGLHAIGPLSERIWGRWRFLALYLISGVGGSVTAAFLQLRHPPEPLWGLVGASGALWGIMSAVAVWVVLNRRHLPPQLYRSWTGNLLSVFVINIVLSFVPGISAAAHFGGGAVGAVGAVLLNASRFGGFAGRAVAMVLLFAIPAVLIAGLRHQRERAPGWPPPHEFAQKEEQQREVRAVNRERQELDARLETVGAHEAAALRQYKEKAEVVVSMKAERRATQPEQRLAEAAAALDKGTEELRQAARVLENSGPYKDAYAERVRKARLDVLAARIEAFLFDRETLEKKDDPPLEDEKKRRQLEGKIKDLQKEFDRVFKAG